MKNHIKFHIIENGQKEVRLSQKDFKENDCLIFMFNYYEQKTYYFYTLINGQWTQQGYQTNGVNVNLISIPNLESSSSFMHERLEELNLRVWWFESYGQVYGDSIKEEYEKTKSELDSFIKDFLNLHTRNDEEDFEEKYEKLSAWTMVDPRSVDYKAESNVNRNLN